MLTTLVRVHAIKHVHIHAIHLIHQAFSFLLNVFGGGIGFGPVVHRLNLFPATGILVEPVGGIDLGTTALFRLQINWFERFPRVNSETRIAGRSANAGHRNVALAAGPHQPGIDL